ncbi:hypothetical protein ONZ43_g878 [Nemania bipapillata]|uniref:Uncharacterized protein n=1 Tax=Nemania bipapillata TaxID=110536 RepID=A0ACC2J6V6_9PEZI|nr:hypothetical protein ONZ43_g878 [Nemania bipapillata]
MSSHGNTTTVTKTISQTAAVVIESSQERWQHIPGAPASSGQKSTETALGSLGHYKTANQSNLDVDHFPVNDSSLRSKTWAIDETIISISPRHTKYGLSDDSSSTGSDDSITSQSSSNEEEPSADTAEDASKATITTSPSLTYFDHDQRISPTNSDGPRATHVTSIAEDPTVDNTAGETDELFISKVANLMEDNLDDEGSSSTIKNSSTIPVPISTGEPTVHPNDGDNKAINAKDGLSVEISSTSADDSRIAQASNPTEDSTEDSTAVNNTKDETPFPYTVGQVLELQTPEGGRLSATITKLYSMTMSPVLAVRLDGWNGPQEVVLKLYDRRFGDQRRTWMSDGPPVPHTTRAEEAWQKYIREDLVEPLIKEIIEEENDFSPSYIPFGDDSDDEEEEQDNRPEWEKLGEMEGTWYYAVRKGYTREVLAYKELQHLQGYCIPKLFSTVFFDMPSAQSDLPAVYFQVPGILIEKLDGFMLMDIVEKMPKESLSVWQKVVQDAADLAAEVNRLGVLHRDCFPRNVIVSPSGQGEVQLYLVDFARANFKRDRPKECSVLDNPCCRCWGCETVRQDDAQDIGANMLKVVRRATGHWMEIHYDQTRP